MKSNKDHGIAQRCGDGQKNVDGCLEIGLVCL